MEENLMPQVFAHEEFGKVRVVMKDGEPWFVVADVGRILELTNVRMSLANLDDDEKGVSNIYTPGGEQQMSIVNEPGLYRLIFTSRVDGAKKFQRWVYHEVLPSIRKTGSYSVANVNPLAHAISELAAVEREKFNVENSEETKLFKRAQLLRDIASSSKDDFLRDKLLHEATKILMGNDFFKEITDDID